MIPKIWCWIFGHIIIKRIDGMENGITYARYYYADKCRRCGKDLT